MYSFIESKSSYINLVRKCRVDRDIENTSAPKKRYLRTNRKFQDEEKTDRESALKTIREIVKRKFPKRADEKIDLYLKEVIGNECLRRKVPQKAIHLCKSRTTPEQLAE